MPQTLLDSSDQIGILDIELDDTLLSQDEMDIVLLYENVRRIPAKWNDTIIANFDEHIATYFNEAARLGFLAQLQWLYHFVTPYQLPRYDCLVQKTPPYYDGRENFFVTSWAINNNDANMFIWGLSHKSSVDIHIINKKEHKMFKDIFMFKTNYIINLFEADNACSILQLSTPK